MTHPLEDAARSRLEAVFGPGGATATGFAPGRVTLVGEHVDYAEGQVLCAAVQLGVAASVRPSGDALWRVASGGRRAVRPDAELRGDMADRVLAVARALGAEGIEAPQLEVCLAADLPEGAGLSSSAALSVAVLVALLRHLGRSVPRAEAVRLAFAAEHDVLGVPCGTLDMRAVVGAPAGGALLLDFRDGTDARVPWGVSGTALVAVDTGSAHAVGGAGYRARRSEADSALRGLGAASWRDVTEAGVAASSLPDLLRRRARHITGETRRAGEAAEALRTGDATTLGELMSASHTSLRDDYEVSTSALDACCAAAEREPGCLGARLVGAGFGGTAVALVRAREAGAVREAMAGAAGGLEPRTWILEPSAGAAERAPDVLV